MKDLTSIDFDRLTFLVRQLLDARPSLTDKEKAMAFTLSALVKVAPEISTATALAGIDDAVTSLLLAGLTFKELEKQGVDVDRLLSAFKEWK